jgi:hypothetical protein
LKLLPDTAVPGALLNKGGRAGEDVFGMGQQELQVFVERVDSLGGSPVGDRDPQVEGASPQTLMPEGRGLSLGATPSLLPLGPAVSQDKVNGRKYTCLSLLCCTWSSYCFGLF